ncbi:hypothetical protein JTB14_020634 [Gonioctena quinquepunctata]|nr:hypothetical protein JTB14_020634 [Gonioctena quinquepunctata]
MVTSTDSQGSNEQKCIYCKALGHKIYKCTEFNSEPTSTRKEFISKERLCFYCFDKHLVLFMKTRLEIFHMSKRSMKKDLIILGLILKCKDLLTLKLKDHISKGLFSLKILLLLENLPKFKH